MISYNRDKPLIIIHIPKAAGTSAREIFGSWFKQNFHWHYYDEVNGKMPQKFDLNALHSPEHPVAVYGHFNKLRQFGIEDYYPEVDQFVTILRDPFELLVSQYFYVRKASDNWKNKSRVPTSALQEYLQNTPVNMLNHFPRHVSLSNYRDIIDELFIEIGIAEKLAESLTVIAGKLGFFFDESKLQILNKTERDQEVPGWLREWFVDTHPLEHEIYHFAQSRYL